MRVEFGVGGGGVEVLGTTIWCIKGGCKDGFERAVKRWEIYGAWCVDKGIVTRRGCLRSSGARDRLTQQLPPIYSLFRCALRAPN
jgi:hypothetical protein